MLTTLSNFVTSQESTRESIHSNSQNRLSRKKDFRPQNSSHQQCSSVWLIVIRSAKTGSSRKVFHWLKTVNLVKRRPCRSKRNVIFRLKIISNNNTTRKFHAVKIISSKSNERTISEWKNTDGEWTREKKKKGKF